MLTSIYGLCAKIKELSDKATENQKELALLSFMASQILAELYRLPDTAKSTLNTEALQALETQLDAAKALAEVAGTKSSVFGRFKAVFSANQVSQQITAIFENLRKQMDLLHLSFDVASLERLLNLETGVKEVRADLKEVGADLKEVGADLKLFLARCSEETSLAVERFRFEIDDRDVDVRKTTRGTWNPEDRLGGGGYSEVWKGTYKGMYVAVKTMRDPAKWMAKQMRDLFEREAWNHYRIHHPHIVHCHGAISSVKEGQQEVPMFWIVLELLDVTLTHEIKNPKSLLRRDRNTECLRICEEAADAVAYLHSLSPQLLHRDLKTDNVMLNSSRQVKLIDLGMSKEKDDHSTSAETKQSLTQGLVGTRSWMPPEVNDDPRADFLPASDVFGLGLVMAAGLLLPPDPDLFALKERVTLRDKIGRCSAPTAFTELIILCVSNTPMARPKARKVLDTLRFVRAHTQAELPCGKAEDAMTEELRIYLSSIGLGSTPKFSETLNKLSEDCITVSQLKTISELDLEQMKIVRGHRITILNAQKVPQAPPSTSCTVFTPSASALFSTPPFPTSTELPSPPSFPNDFVALQARDSAVPVPGPPPPGLPAGWQEAKDVATGRTYYYHGESGHSQWEPPVPLPAPPTPPPPTPVPCAPSPYNIPERRVTPCTGLCACFFLVQQGYLLACSAMHSTFLLELRQLCASDMLCVTGCSGGAQAFGGGGAQAEGGSGEEAEGGGGAQARRAGAEAEGGGGTGQD